MRQVWQVIWKGKWVIILTTVIFGIAGALYSRNWPDIYQSSTSLTFFSGRDLLNSFTNYGDLIAVNSSYEDKVQNTEIAVETLNSRVFLNKFINKYNLKPELLVVKSWNPEENGLIIDNSIYDKQEKSWLSNGELKKESEPSDEAAVSKLQNSLNTNLNPNNHIVMLSVKHYSPFIAQTWTQ